METIAVGALALLRWGKGVVVSLQRAVRLRVELGLEGRKLLRDAEEPSDLHAQDHPNDIWAEQMARWSVTVF